MCKKKPGLNYLFLIIFYGRLDLERFVHVTISVKFPLLLRDPWRIFGKDFDGIRYKKQKGVDWYIFRIFNNFFSMCQIFGV